MLLSVNETRRNTTQRWMLSLVAVLFSATLAAAQQQSSTPVTSQSGDMPQIVTFNSGDVLGNHIHNSISSLHLVSPAGR